MRVVTERMENVRSVALGFWIGTGSAMESEDQAGLSHLLEHMLFRGTDSYRSEEIDQIFDAMGAEINAGTDRETTSLYTRVLDRHLERALHVMGEMLWKPRFEDLAAEREVVLEEIAMYEDDPQDRVFDVLGEAVFGIAPAGARRDRARRGGARDRARRAARLSSPSAICRGASWWPPPARSTTTSWSGWCGGRSAASARRTAYRRLRSASRRFERRVRFLRKDTEQYHVCLGGRGIARDDERRFALRVIEGVLGGTSSSRLFQEVREKRGLAYSVFSFSNLHARTGEVGPVRGHPSGEPGRGDGDDRRRARALRRGTRRDNTPEELTRSRENVKGRVVLALESTAARMSRLGSSVLSELPILSVDEIIERIDGVRALGPEGTGRASCSSASDCRLRALDPIEGTFDAALRPLWVWRHDPRGGRRSCRQDGRDGVRRRARTPPTWSWWVEQTRCSRARSEQVLAREQARGGGRLHAP